MADTFTPFGLRPVWHPSGLDRAKAYTIASGYGTAIYKGDPVALVATGVVARGTAGASVLGVFDGVQYTDANGKPSYSNYWPANTAATDIIAWVWDDPQTVFEIQANGPIGQTAVGDQADFALGSPSTALGLSGAYLSSGTFAGSGSSAGLRVIGFSQYPDNVVGSGYVIAQVQIAEHQFVANKNAI